MTTDNASRLATILLQEVPTYFSWQLANGHSVLWDSYSEVFLNIVNLTFNQ